MFRDRDYTLFSLMFFIKLPRERFLDTVIAISNVIEIRQKSSFSCCFSSTATANWLGCGRPKESLTEVKSAFLPSAALFVKRRFFSKKDRWSVALSRHWRQRYFDLPTLISFGVRCDI